jgi:hypothetical protein
MYFTSHGDCHKSYLNLKLYHRDYPLFVVYFNLNMMNECEESNDVWLLWCVSFVTEKDQLIYLSGSLINSPMIGRYHKMYLKS